MKRAKFSDVSTARSTAPSRRTRSSRRSYDAGLARRLWQVSEELTGVKYEALGVPV